MRFIRAYLITLAAILLLSGELWAASDVEVAWNQAVELESSGQFVPAAEALKPVADKYPQDFSAQLQVAWLYYQGKAYALALPYYQRADALSGTPGLARLGLGWTHLGLNQPSPAEAAFSTYLASNPDNPINAPEGLEIARRMALEKDTVKSAPWVVSASLRPNLLIYTDNPSRESGFGGAIDVGLSRGAFAARLGYGLTQFTLVGNGQSQDQPSALEGNGSGTTRRAGEMDGTGNGSDTAVLGAGAGNGEGGASYTEHSVFGSVALGSNGFGASLDGAAVSNVSNLQNVYWAAGTTLRLSVWNDLYVGAHYTSLAGLYSVQSTVAYDIQMSEAFWITPAVLLQFPEEEDTLGAGKLAVSYRSRPFGAFIAGRYGQAQHEVDFVNSVFATHNDLVIGGAAAGVMYWLGPAWALGTSVAWESYEDSLDHLPSSGYFGSIFLLYNSGGTP